MKSISTFAFVCGTATWIACVAGCSSTSTNAAESRPDGGVPDGAAPDGGVPESCMESQDSSLAGTWRILGSGAGSSNSTLTIDSTTFAFVSDNTSLVYKVEGSAMTLAWSDDESGTEPVAVTRTPGNVDLGQLPPKVGGTWRFGEPGTGCIATLTERAFTADCNAEEAPVGDVRLKGKLVGERISTLPSIFGALGGTWHLAGSGSSTVDVTIEGHTFKAVSTAEGLEGETTFTVCNGVASGSTSSGYEFAAMRE